ncbi:MAG: PAS domain S-box protein [Pseudomonadota bacterium]
MSLILEISNCLSISKHRPSNISQEICNKLISHYPYNIAWIGTMGPDRSIHIESMEGDLISHINSIYLSQINPDDSENPIKTCIVKRIPIHIEYRSVNVKYGSDWNDFLEKTNSASLLSQPLLNNDQCTGILGIHSKASNSFTDNIECSLLALVAQYLSDHYEIQRRIRDYSTLANQSKLVTVIFDTVQEGIIITNAQGRIISVNPALTQVTGYSSEELIGQMPSILQSGVHDKNFYSAMWQKITRVNGKVKYGINVKTIAFTRNLSA